MWYKPLGLPGAPNRPPDKPGIKRCPKCNLLYKHVTVKRNGKKVTRHCPRCGAQVG